MVPFAREFSATVITLPPEISLPKLDNLRALPDNRPVPGNPNERMGGTFKNERSCMK